ncbi:MAG: pyridoxamine 5'-phosphate oxidase family protein [Acetatifactor sp.]
MKTGEKIALLRKRKELTQEQMAELLGVSRQSVSRWEMNIAFPEVEKLVRLSRLLECSIDFLLNENDEEEVFIRPIPSVKEAYLFLRECGYFFLATAQDGKPTQRPMGMVYCDEKALYIGTDRRKKLFSEVMENPYVSIASYNIHTRRWIRITGEAYEETSIEVYNAMQDTFPMLKQKYSSEDDVFFATLRVNISSIEMD